jgi:hypothetical protein
MGGRLTGLTHLGETTRCETVIVHKVEERQRELMP